jgi:hypothetical protein
MGQLSLSIRQASDKRTILRAKYGQECKQVQESLPYGVWTLWAALNIPDMTLNYVERHMKLGEYAYTHTLDLDNLTEEQVKALKTEWGRICGNANRTKTTTVIVTTGGGNANEGSQGEGQTTTAVVPVTTPVTTPIVITTGGNPESEEQASLFPNQEGEFQEGESGEPAKVEQSGLVPSTPIQVKQNYDFINKQVPVLNSAEELGLWAQIVELANRKCGEDPKRKPIFAALVEWQNWRLEADA